MDMKEFRENDPWWKILPDGLKELLESIEEIDDENIKKELRFSAWSLWQSKMKKELLEAKFYLPENYGMFNLVVNYRILQSKIAAEKAKKLIIKIRKNLEKIHKILINSQPDLEILKNADLQK